MRRAAARELPSYVELIARKRDGGSLSDEEIGALIEAYAQGTLADYQMSALAMAIVLRGMSPRETRALTLAMRDSGETVDLSSVPGEKIDKHSTGGVGDKVSLCLAPIVAACGVNVPMISGRGLGHTGGTLDKLEAISGFSVDLSIPRFVRQLRRLGCALIGQTKELAPADKRLYALRDVTATVESIPLITASILSKKLAEGIDGLVLDVKVGSGAFMKSEEDARALARSLVRVGKLAGKKVIALLTRMDAPLGYAVGNALETAEAMRVLAGEGPEDLVECTMALGAEMIVMAGVERSRAKARKAMRGAIASGAAIAKMEAIVAAQGGDPRVVQEVDRLPQATRRLRIQAVRDGYIQGIDAREVGLAAVALGAGRGRVDDRIDPAVGIVLHKKPGERVRRAELLATLHVGEESNASSIKERIRGAVNIGARRPQIPRLVVETIR